MKDRFKIQKDHIENTRKQIDVMDQKNTQRTTRSLEVNEVIEDLDDRNIM